MSSHARFNIHAQGKSKSSATLTMRPFARAILAGLAMATVAATPAFAQDPAAPASASSAPTKSKTTELKAVVVTGSLIAIPNAVSSSPIVTIDLATLKASTGDTSTVGVLNQLPQFSATSSNFLGGTAGGIQTLNLRGLGANRNLVLLDGRRLPTADAFGDVAINMIPEAAIGEIDTITGGASAVYGSDAMSGVVNFHTIPYFDGIKGDVQYGNSTKEDFAQRAASVALGSAFDGGKGHMLLALGYTDSQALQGTRRSFFDLVTPSSYIGPSTFVPSATNLPSQSAVNSLFAGYGAFAPVSNSLNLGFNDNGTLFTQTGAKNYLGPRSGKYAVLGGNVRMPVGPQFLIGVPVKRKQAFSKFDYDLTPNVTLYGQFMYVSSDIFAESGGSLTQFGNLTTIPTSNPFIPADLRTLLASRPNPNAPFTWNGRYVGVPYKNVNSVYTTSQYLVGAKGNLPFGDWTYDAYASHSSTNLAESMGYSVLKSRVQTLLNAPDGGNSICAGGFDPFGLVNSSNISQACQNYMTTTANNQTKLTQDIVQASVTGSLFDVPAGSVKMAVLVDGRRNTYAYLPSEALSSQDIEAVIAAAPARGSINVKEAAVQFAVPILADLPFAKSLDFDAAYRRSDYNTSGGVGAYEADLKWRPDNSLLVRAGYQHAVRAPNVGELFSAATGVQVPFGTPPQTIGDPCDIRSVARTGGGGASVRQLCMQQGIPASVINSYVFPTTAVAGVQSGNPNLKPETANTYNVGLQWMSAFESPVLSTMSASLDYYNINISNVISVVPGLTTLSKCYNLDGSNPNYSAGNYFCSLLSRDSNGQLQLVRTPYLNLGSLKTDGLDLQFNWAPSLASLGMSAGGSLFLSSYFNYMHSYEIQTLPGSAVQEYVNTISVGASHPRWKAMTTFGYNNQDLTVGVRWHYLGAMKDSTSVTTPLAPAPGVPSYQTYDLYGTYWLNDKLQLRAGINDVTDKKSITVSSSQWSTDPSLYNPVGRSYYVGLSFSM
ncbi:MAG: TonB-dependent receptor [Rhodanobacter sp.]